MLYSLVPLLGIILISILEFDMLFRVRYTDPLKKVSHLRFKIFIIAVFAFLISDMLWGIFDELHWAVALRVDTTMFFLLFAFSVFAWTQFVVAYFKQKTRFTSALSIIGWVILGAIIVLLVVDLFYPILFIVDDAGKYTPLMARFFYFDAIALLYLLSSIYLFIKAPKVDSELRTKHITVAMFGLLNAILVFAQLFFALFPLLATGFIIGMVLIQINITGEEKQVFIKTIQESKIHATIQEQELDATKQLAFTDALTGAKNKHAYVEIESQMDEAIREKRIDPFSVIVFDLNDLKRVNDTQGHEAGDRYIVAACRLIESYFPGCDLYRYGGDEFAIIVGNEDYEERRKHLFALNKKVERNLISGGPVIATGISDFIPEQDNTLRAVFARADELMYTRKRILKAMHDQLHQG